VANATAGLREAVPIVGALAGDLAERMSVRALLIKGAPATAMGVRAPRPSVDVDIWVDPRRLIDYQRGLATLGWVKRPGQHDGLGWGHSVELAHPKWPCTIDLHRKFPGFLADDDAVFDLAWTSRTTASVAHQRVAVPGRVMAAAITVVHAARSSYVLGPADDRAAALETARMFTPGERAELLRLVTATGSQEPLAELLAAAGCEAPASSPDTARLEEWRTRLRVGNRPGGVWLLALRQASWPRRVRLVGQAMLPHADDYAESGADRSVRGFMRASRFRWRRAARALPGAVRDVRSAAAARGR
jgi:hypothetical protein